MTPEQYFNLQFHHLGENFKIPIHLDTILISLGLGLLAQWIVYRGINRELISNPTGRISKFQVVIEWMYEYISSRVSLSKATKVYRLIHSFGMTAIIWILSMNIIDLLPASTGLFLSGGRPFHLVPTEDLNLTMSLGFVSLILLFFTKIARKGLVQTLLHYLKHPLGYVAFPLNLILNIAETLSPSISLGARLFGNMFAGAIVFVLCGMAPSYINTILSFVWTMIHFPMSILQIVVFVNLSLNYIQHE
jgi:F-type H+-transporting ATPase subunit a